MEEYQILNFLREIMVSMGRIEEKIDNVPTVEHIHNAITKHSVACKKEVKWVLVTPIIQLTASIAALVGVIYTVIKII